MDRLADRRAAFWACLVPLWVAAPAKAIPPPIQSIYARPVLPPPVPASPAGLPRLRSGLAHDALSRPSDEASREAARLQADLMREVPSAFTPAPPIVADMAARAQAMLRMAGQQIDEPQLVVVVDRNPAAERLVLMLARPGNAPWRAIGAVHVSTGQAHRKDYYITPIGAFAHTDAILDFRALGTRNEHHVRGLGLAGMRVWDFGWQWALKGWHTDQAGGDIRLQMHATDPDLLERRLGHPASEGCVRIPTAFNRFMDLHGVLDADYERAAVTDIRYRALLLVEREPTLIAGRLMIVIDSSLPIDTPPTQASRPPDWPAPDMPPPDDPEPPMVTAQP